VRSVTVESARSTVLSQIYRLQLAYDGDAADGPASLVFKTKHPTLDYGAWKYGEHEVAFYRDVAPATPADLLPRCFDSRWDDATRDWHFLLEDLASTHTITTTWPVPPSLGDCETIVRGLARFHAAWWDDPRLGISVGRWTDPADLEASRGKLAAAVARFTDVLGDRLPPARRARYGRLIERLGPLSVRYHSHRNMTIVHGDAHVWNWFVPKSGVADTARLFDWDSWRPDIATDDLAYMMALHWFPDMRQAREAHLLDIYHHELLSQGVEGYDRQSLQDDYRLSVLWMTTTPVWQFNGNIPPAIWWPHLERIHLAADDLRCDELLD
jgi:thiamine kinase-like enzyme